MSQHAKQHALVLSYRGDDQTPDDAPYLAPASDAPPPNPIQAMDEWARYTWRRHTSIWPLFIALPLWLTIRIGYQAARVMGAISYVITQPFKWLFWRLYEWLGPLARVGKYLFWTFLYPVLERIGKAAGWIFWRLYALFGPTARALKSLYWGVLHPPLELAWRALRWTYWRALYPILSPIAKLLGFSLTGKTVKEEKQTPSHQSAAEAHAAKLRVLFRELDEDASIVWPARSLSDFTPLFDCAPRFGLSEPNPAGLYVWLAPELAEETALQLRQLGLRLRSGSPFQRVWFYTPNARAAAAFEQALECPVRVLRGCDSSDFSAMVAQRELPDPPSLIVTRFGPVVLLISALWGRVGSTMIFDAQTQFLLENGAVVVRAYVDHNPGHGAERAPRRDQLIRENLTVTRPHLLVVAERIDTQRGRAQIHSNRAYATSSAVRRFELELETAIPTDEGLLAWAGAAAELVIVNHAMHMAFAQRISSAPIVLETHDVMTAQLDSHGWPQFVSMRGEPAEQREADQQAIWKRAAACVNLSPDDNQIIGAYNSASRFVRPYAPAADAAPRPWDKVVEANGLSRRFAENEEIDLLLWGDWHEGNVRATRWALTKVIKDHPALAEARVAVIGRVAKVLPARLLHNTSNTVSAGFVDHLDDFFARAKVLVIADQEGSGVSIKAIEAVRYGRPFVATREGLRGLDYEGLGYTPPATAAEFAEDLATLLADTEARAERAKISRAIYARNFSKDAYERQWREVLMAVDPDFFETDNQQRLRAAPVALTQGPALGLAPISATLAPAATAPTPAASAPALARPRATYALAAVICTYNRYDVLPGAIESLLKQDIDPDDLEILVIDNSPDQEAAAKFGEAYADTRVRYLLEPIPGLSNARNVGAEACSAKYVAYIDDDAVAAPDWACKLVAGLQKFSPKAGVAGGRIIPRWITPRPDWLPDELIGNLSIVDWGGSARELGKLEWIAGCNIAFETKTLLQLGGFSRALGRIGAGAALLSNEESEVIEKFAAAGRSALYVPEATVEHLIEPARLSREWFRRRSAWQAVSDYIKDPKKSAAYARVAMERLRRELAAEGDALPPGFVQPEAGVEQFRTDVGLMYDVVIAMLAGGVELGDDAASASLQEKLLASVRREMQKNPRLRSTIRKLANI